MSKAGNNNFYAVVPIHCLQELTGTELKVLCVIVSHDIQRKCVVDLTRQTIAEKIGVKKLHNVSSALSSLEYKGFIQRTVRFRKSSRFKITLPGYPPKSTLPKIGNLPGNGEGKNGEPLPKIGNLPQYWEGSGTLSNDNGKLQDSGTLPKIGNLPKKKGPKNWDAEEVRKKKEEQKENVREKTSRRKPLIKDPQKLEKAIMSIDLQPFKKEFGPLGLDVEQELRVFCNYHAGNQNPRDWRDWRKAFENRCLAKTADAKKAQKEEVVPLEQRPFNKEDLQAEKDKAEYIHFRSLIDQLPDHEKRPLRELALTILKRNSPGITRSDIGYSIELKRSEVEAYQKIYE
jgi:predicted transcriptional regulator